MLDTASGVGISPLSVSLPAAGTYYVTLRPVGAGNPPTDGYSTYGSRGQFELRVAYPVPRASSPSPSVSPVFSWPRHIQVDGNLERMLEGQQVCSALIQYCSRREPGL